MRNQRIGCGIQVTIAGFIASTLTAALAGCQHAEQRMSRRTVSLAEFAQSRQAGQSAPALIPPTVSEQAEETMADEPVASAAADPGPTLVDDVADLPGLPERQPQMFSRPGDQLIIEGKIGEVNGRPIFAEEILGKAESRILAIWADTQKSLLQKRFDIERFLGEGLQELLNTELIIADAESQLTPEQQIGLFAFLRDLQERTIAQGGGSRAEREEQLRDTEGTTLEEYMEEGRSTLLVHHLRNLKIMPRVIVSWRDIEREYKYRESEFYTPASVVLARISLRTDRDADLIELVKSELAAGVPFAMVAEHANVPNGGMWDSYALGSDGRAVDLQSRVADAIAQLEPGQTSPAIELDNTVWWVHLISYQEESRRDVYDPEVQRMLKETITSRRREEEISRYIMTLRDRWVADDIQKMQDRLFEIARKRYMR